jgi:hypothetical protein
MTTFGPWTTLRLVISLFAALSLHCTSTTQGTTSNDDRFLFFQKVVPIFGDNMGNHVPKRLLMHLRNVKNTIVTIPEYGSKFSIRSMRSDERTIVISFGNTSLSSRLCSSGDLSSKKSVPESYRIVVERIPESSHSVVLCVDGEPLSIERHSNISFDVNSVNYGAVTGSYAALELLGFGFLHPLQPNAPSQLQLDVQDFNVSNESSFRNGFIYEQPYWPERGFHIHTQHPLELTEVLQGHDIPQFGPHGPECRKFSKRGYGSENQSVDYSLDNLSESNYCERWEDMVIDVDYFFEWSVANRLNKVEWLLLSNFKWGDELQTRFHRFKKLVDLAHKYSLLVGADVPIGNVQQHAWSMVNVRLPLQQQVLQIQERVDWLFAAGFDFLTTESGLSEFTHPECELMLDLLNAFAKHVNGSWGREAAIKVHCSTGQHCENYLDPRTGDLLNFNFLPTYADNGLAVFPHTVQVYAFDDPIGGAYGNQNFSYVEDYLIYEAKRGQRSVMYYGETAYWVSVDVDVPLFLPLYGQRRLRDLYKIAVREQTENFHMDGQMNFDSGWEWGYWLGDVVTARASWNPFVGRPVGEINGDFSEPHYLDSGEEEKNIANFHLAGEWTAFGASIRPFTRLFGPQFAPKIENLIVSLSKIQADVLINGKIHGRPSPDVSKLSGIAYLSGFDTWSEIPRLFKLAMTQPNKVFMKEENDPLWPYVLELLEHMESIFLSVSDQMHSVYEEIETYNKLGTNGTGYVINDSAMNLLAELRDCVDMLWLRSKQVMLLYDSKQAQVMQIEALSSGESTLRYKLLLEAREVLKEATAIVKRREASYRTHWERVGAWRENPTVYRFGYLWSVHSLYYWWRDQGLAETSPFVNPHSPCYLNRMDSTEVAVGWGKSTLEFLRTFINRYTLFSTLYPLEIFNCLSSPASEYEFPRDLHSVKPMK